MDTSRCGASQSPLSQHENIEKRYGATPRPPKSEHGYGTMRRSPKPPQPPSWSLCSASLLGLALSALRSASLLGPALSLPPVPCAQPLTNCSHHPMHQHLCGLTWWYSCVPGRMILSVQLAVEARSTYIRCPVPMESDGRLQSASH